MALRSILRRRDVEQELDEELRVHLEQMEAQAALSPDDPVDARRRARAWMGSLDQVKEACRDTRTVQPTEEILRDVRYGARLLARSPGFTLVAVLSLALGIGASSTIFSVINAVVLRPLPVANPDELSIASVIEPDEVDDLFSSAAVERASELLTGRADLAAHSSTTSVMAALRGDDSQPEPARLQLIAGDYFGALRQRARVGRLIGPGDNRVLGGHPVAVISDRYWHQRFGRSTRALDSELIVNGTALTIIGVTTPEFFGTTLERETPDIWAPAAMQAALRFAGNLERTGGDLQQPWPAQPEFSWLYVIIRAPGGHGAVAEAVTRAVAEARPVADRQGEPRPSVTLSPGARGSSQLRSDLTTPLLVLLLMVGLLLAIACANIAGLLLARAATRAREIAIRLSIGAGRSRLIQQLLVESVLLALLGGVLGLGLAYWGSTALLALLSPGGVVRGIDVRPDWRVVSLTCALSMCTAVACGLLPAVRATRLRLTDTLNARTRSVVGSDRPGRAPVTRLIVTGQLAFAIVLLLVGTLFAHSLQALTRVDVGFDRERVLVARIDTRAAGYGVDELPALCARVVERLEALPGVVAVSLSVNGPFSGTRSRGSFQAEGYVAGANEQVVKQSDWVTAHYFRAVGLTVVQGRGFEPQDAVPGRRVSVINETMARRYFAGRSPIGRRWGDSSDFATDGFEIVGVVEDARSRDIKAVPDAMSYTLAEASQRYVRSIEIRTSGDPMLLTAAVREALRASEPRLIVGSIETLGDRISGSMRMDRLLSWLTTAFGIAALGLVCLGLYGTISYGVKRRTSELGLRMALGADRTGVQWLIVREAMLLVLAGAAIGLPLAFVAARLARGLLYETAASEPTAYAMALVTLVVFSAAAAYVPAWRASRLDPVAAIRSDQ